MADITYEKFIEHFKTHFGNTHKIIRTFHGGSIDTKTVSDNSSFILTKLDTFEKIIKPAINNFRFNWSPENQCLLEIRNNGQTRLNPMHSIVYIN